MPRYALKVEYNGTSFHGWQYQIGHASVQASLEAALTRLNKSPVRIAAAGRTDTGVHATGQVAHADMSADWAPFKLMEALNWHLRPNPIAITACAEVSEDWHARFSAKGRHYLYRIATRRAPIIHGPEQVWHVKHMMDADAMHEAAQHLLGQHDFTTFRATQCQAASPIKTLDRLDVLRSQGPLDVEIHVIAEARSFLHNQVRSIVGSLAQVGLGRWPAEQMAEALRAADRTACGPVAPPQGLFLTNVVYDPAPF